MKLTMFEKIMFWMGYRYIYNKESNEVHRLSTKHKNCNLQLMSRKNKQYITYIEMKLKFAQGADGCRWCYSEKNTG
jgi:hypothetical protein